MSDSQINIDQLAARGHNYELSVSNESPEDATARREREAADADLRRRMSFGLFLFALAVVAAIVAGCLLTFANGNAEDKKWAGGIVSAIASGLVGFLVGQGRR